MEDTKVDNEVFIMLLIVLGGIVGSCLGFFGSFYFFIFDSASNLFEIIKNKPLTEMGTFEVVSNVICLFIAKFLIPVFVIIGGILGIFPGIFYLYKYDKKTTKRLNKCLI